VLYAVISLIDWRCHLFGGGDKEIAGTGIWIAPGHARINENVWLSELPLAFTIRAHTPASEIGAEGRIGWLRYDPPWEADELGGKQDAQLCVVLVVAREQFADLWERGPGRIPQRIFVEVEGFRDEYEYTPGDKIWELNPAENAEVWIRACTFQNIADRVTNDAYLRQEGRFRYRGDQVIGFGDVRALMERHTREHHDSKKPQHSAILKDLYACIGREFMQRGEASRSELDEEFANVEQLVNSLDLALNRQAIKEVEEADGRRENPSKERLWIWRRGNPVTVFPEGLKSTARRTVDRGELNDVTLSYLQKSYLRSDLLEWIIVDAFVLYEIQEFGETIKQGTGFRSLLRYWARDGRLRVGASLWQLILVPMILAGWIAGLAYVTPRTGEHTCIAVSVWRIRRLFHVANRSANFSQSLRQSADWPYASAGNGESLRPPRY
jgi:hypothetical protein